jgi:hypothetical protein
MNPPAVTFRLPDGTEVEVGEGGLIGRASTAQLRLTDPAVSEGHAMVSLRGRELRLLALRRSIVVNDVPVAEATLRAGQRVHLSHDTTLHVVRVVLPEDGLPVPNATFGEEHPPVRVVVGNGVVRISQGGAPEATFARYQGELLRLLAEAEEPVHWTKLARYFWPERDQLKWRERFDALVKEVRRRLRDHRVRADLLWSWDGSYRLHLGEGDELVVGRGPE